MVKYLHHHVLFNVSVTELKPKVKEGVDSSPALSTWMVYALAFSVVYSLIAWPCVIRVCEKPAAKSQSSDSEAV